MESFDRLVRYQTLTAIVLVIVVAPLGAGCGDDEATTASSVSSSADANTASATAPASTVALQDACSLVPDADAAAATDLTLGPGAPDGDERRRVCTFQAENADVGVTVGIESGAVSNL